MTIYIYIYIYICGFGLVFLQAKDLGLLVKTMVNLQGSSFVSGSGCTP